MRALIIASAVVAGVFGLSGCAVYEVASTAVDVTTIVAGGVVDVAGDIVTAPFSHDDSGKRKDN